MADRDHEVRNVLALVRGHLELARESLATGRTEEVATDVTAALAAVQRLEALLAWGPAEEPVRRAASRRGRP